MYWQLQMKKRFRIRGICVTIVAEGSEYMGYIIVVLAAYLLGSSSMTYYLGRLKNVDVQSHGSGNLGASNATVTMGWGAGVLVGIHDIGKGVLAVVLARLLFPELVHIGAVAGVACVLGHMFPFYLGFKGGKGLASYLGMMLALDWRVALGVILLLVLVTVMTDFIALGTLSVVIASPVGVGILAQDIILPLILLAASAVMVSKHMDNIQRIRKGTEIGLRSTIKGEHRVK